LRGVPPGRAGRAPPGRWDATPGDPRSGARSGVGDRRAPRLPRLDRARRSYARALRRRLPRLPRLHARDRAVPELAQPAARAPGRLLPGRAGRARGAPALVERAGAEPAPGLAAH